MMQKYLCAVYVLLFVITSSQADKTKKEDLLENLKQANVSWTVAANPTELHPSSEFPKMQKICSPCPVASPSTSIRAPPVSFDSRNKWRVPCGKILNRIRNQGTCAGSWAIATASMLSDRLCISTDGETAVHLSAELLLSCCEICLQGYPSSCKGGAPVYAIDFWIKKGLVTGGEVDSAEGCVPYSKDSFGGKAPECTNGCTTGNHTKAEHYKGGYVYKLPNSESIIRQELFNKGPLLAKLTVYEDLAFYGSGIYARAAGNLEGIQFVKIVGYGVEGGRKFWQIAASHGETFGDKGYIKILRGANHCGIEGNVIGVNIEKSYDDYEEGELDDNEDDDHGDHYQYTDPYVDYRAAAVDDGDMLEPSMGKYVLIEIIFFYLYLNLCN